MEIVNQNEIIEELVKRTDYPQETIEHICDGYMKLLFEYMETSKSISYKGFPVMKTKYFVSKQNENSPRTPRNDRIQITIKLSRKNFYENHFSR